MTDVLSEEAKEKRKMLKYIEEDAKIMQKASSPVPLGLGSGLEHEIDWETLENSYKAAMRIREREEKLKGRGPRK